VIANISRIVWHQDDDDDEYELSDNFNIIIAITVHRSFITLVRFIYSFYRKKLTSTTSLTCSQMSSMTTRPTVGRTTNFWLLDDICLLTKKLQITNANVEKRKRQKKYQKC